MADTFARYHCNYCEENIIGLRIKCVECEDFDLCLECFSYGAQIGKHKAVHAYQFMDTGQYNLFGNSHKDAWTAREEVRLLDAIEQYGYGNWQDISRHIETRTAEEARLKFISCYIEGNIGKATWGPAMERRQLPFEHTNTGDPLNADTPEGPLSPTLPSSLKAGSEEEEVPPEQAIALGSMQLRDDFDREYDNEAECAIAPLFLHPTDDEDIDVALKLAQVDMYMRKLRERTRRKKVVRDFQLIQQFFKKEQDKHQYPQPRKKNKDEKEVISEKLRGLSQFQTASEHYNLVDSLLREKQLRTRIRELNRYRRNGIKNVEECFEFDTARARREKRKDTKKKAMASLNTQTQTAPGLQMPSKGENGERNPKFLSARRSTAPDTGDGKWLSENCSDNNSKLAESEDLPEVSSLPGYYLLSHQEKQLISSLNMKPAQYIAYKAVVVKESFESEVTTPFTSRLSGSGLHKKMWRPPGIDPDTQERLHTFIGDSGWLTSSVSS